MNYSKLVTGTFAALFAGATLWAAAFFVQMERDLMTLKQQEKANQRRLDEALARLQEQQKYLEQLQRDPALVEQIIRQKLGYAKSQEFVFRFEEEKK